MTASFSHLDAKRIFATFLRLVCGLILIYASQDKLGNADKFTGILEEYHILPHTLLPLAAVVVPWLEFFTGVCLVLGYKWRGAALLFCTLMSVYALSLGWNLAHGVEMNCGCFSMESTEKTTWWSVLRDLGFFLMGALVLVSPDTYATFDRLNAQNEDH